MFRMQIRNTFFTAALATLAAFAVPAAALAAPDADTSKTKTAAVTLSDADLAVLQHHHSVNLLEIHMGKLAATRASAPVKKYGAMLVADHGKADKQALALAKARGAKLEEKPTPANDTEAAEQKKHDDLMTRLATLKGAEFDREYLTAMEEGHTKEVGYLTTAIGNVTDAKLKAHLETVKPVVEKHATEAKALLEKVPATTDAGGTKPQPSALISLNEMGHEAEPAQSPAPSPAKPNPNPAPVAPVPSPAKPNPNPAPIAPAKPTPINPSNPTNPNNPVKPPGVDGGMPPDAGVPPADAPKAPTDAPKPRK